MTRLVIGKNIISEFGAYEECGAIIVGLRLVPGTLVSSLVFQIDTPQSDQRRDHMGMYLELDGKGMYDAVCQFRFNALSDRVDIALVPSKAGGICSVTIEIPPSTESDCRALLTKMSDIFEDRDETQDRG